MREVPYYTTDDDSQWCGHVWRQRREIGGPWGFAWEVIPPHFEEPSSSGWCADQANAEARMMNAMPKQAKDSEVTP